MPFEENMEDNIINVHHIIVESFNSIREPELNIKGVCRGISLRWLEAFLVGEEEQFLKRIEKIIAYNEQFKEKINAFKAKRVQNLNEEDYALVDILAFYDSLSLFHLAHKYTALFNAGLHQKNIEQISAYASSDKSLACGGLKVLYSQSLIYTEAELKNYLDDLALTLDKVSSNSAPIGIDFSSSKHSISIIYRPREGWRIMDINNYPPIFIPANQSHILAATLRSYLKVHAITDYTGFTASVITLGNDARLASLQNELQSLKNHHAVVTEEIASRKIIASDGAWFLNLANMHSYEEIAKVVGDEETLLFINDVPYYINHEDKSIEEIPLTDKNRTQYEKIKKIWRDPVNFVHDGELFALITSLIGCTATTTISLGMLAAREGEAEVLAKLAEHKCFNPNEPYSQGRTLAFTAAQHGHTQCIAELARQGADLNTPDDKGTTPAFAAAESGQSEMIIELNKHGVDLNTAKKDITPCFQAAECGHAKVIAALGECKANLDTPYKNGATPAWIAAQNGHAKVISQLAKYGANLDTPDEEGGSPAFIAAFHGHSRVIAKLGKYGANLVTPKNSFNNILTPAHIAVIKGHRAVIAELMQQGVNLEIKDSKGLTPANLAILLKKTAIIEDFKAYYANQKKPSQKRPLPSLFGESMNLITSTKSDTTTSMCANNLIME